MGVTTQQPPQCGVQVEGQLCLVRTACSGQRAYYHQATGGQQWQTFPDEMTQSALDQIALDRPADGLADDETRTCRGSASPRHVRVRNVCRGGVPHGTAQVDDQ
jgi:hypothetical protein